MWVSPVLAPVEVARIRQHADVLGTQRVADLVAALHLFGEHVEADALHAAGGADEGALDHVVGQADGLEDLRALVGLQGRDAHLGHDLEHALGDAFAVGVDHVVVAADVRRVVR
jgi:hypothetical protein